MKICAAQTRAVKGDIRRNVERHKVAIEVAAFLSDIARKYSMTVLMSNSVGQCDTFECGGKTSIWNDEGALVGQFNDASEGILIIDTKTKELIERTF